MLFETLLFLTIALSPNPILWKLIFALLLAIALSNPKLKSKIPMFMSNFRLKDILIIHKLNFHYNIAADSRAVFREASAEFNKGINLILGPNGTGKTTLLKTIAGVVDSDKGSVYFNDLDLLSLPPHIRPCYFINQNPMDSLAPNLTVTENLFVHYNDFGALSIINNKHDVIIHLMSRLDHYDIPLIRPINDSFWDKSVVTLSGGEAHCIALYCAILSASPILLADEPTNGLDTQNYEQLTTLLKAYSRDHTVLLTSHDARLEALADRKYRVGGLKIEQIC
jgi:ABC-type multidrug transport system ATPase subunit